MQFCTFFFFNDTATTEIYTLSLHDALPIFSATIFLIVLPPGPTTSPILAGSILIVFIFGADRKSTRLNSSHTVISYAVFCLKKKDAHQNFGSTVYVEHEFFYPSSLRHTRSD